jgi:hypothetical protein
VRIPGRGVQILVVEQCADVRDPDATLQQMSRATMTEHVRMDSAFDGSQRRPCRQPLTQEVLRDREFEGAERQRP